MNSFILRMSLETERRFAEVHLYTNFVPTQHIVCLTVRRVDFPSPRPPCFPSVLKLSTRLDVPL